MRRLTCSTATLLVILVQITPFVAPLHLGGVLGLINDDGDGGATIGGSGGGTSNSVAVNAPFNQGVVNIDLKSQGKGGVIGSGNRRSGNGIDVATAQLASGGGDAVIGLDGGGGGGLTLGGGGGLDGLDIGLVGSGGNSFSVDPILDGGGVIGIGGDLGYRGGHRRNLHLSIDGDGGGRRLRRGGQDVVINPIYVQSNPNVDGSTNVRVNNAIDASARGHGGLGGGGGIHIGGGGGGLLGGGGGYGDGYGFGGGGGGFGGGGGDLGLSGAVGGLLLPVVGALSGANGGVVGHLGTQLLGGPGGGLLGPGGGVRGLLGADADGLTVALGGDGVGLRRRRRRRRRNGRQDCGVVGNLLNGLLGNSI